MTHEVFVNVCSGHGINVTLAHELLRHCRGLTLEILRSDDEETAVQLADSICRAVIAELQSDEHRSRQIEKCRGL